MLSQKDVLDYEVRSSPIAGFISWDFAQRLLGKFYASRVRRKYKRYYDSKKVEKRMADAGFDKDSLRRNTENLEEFLVSTFSERIPETRLSATQANFLWILRKVDLTEDERSQVIAAAKVCQFLNL